MLRVIDRSGSDCVCEATVESWEIVAETVGGPLAARILAALRLVARGLRPTADVAIALPSFDVPLAKVALAL